LADERNGECDDLVEYTYSFAMDFEYDDIILYDQKLNGHYPTPE